MDKMNCIFNLILILIIKSSICLDKSGNVSDQIDLNDLYEPVGQMQCSAENLINKMLDIFTPDDYDEGKENIRSDIVSLNQTLIALNRLQEYSRNVSQKLSDFNKRLSNRLSEALMTIDLPTDCMRSLVRIINAAKNGELWALKFFEAQPKHSNGILELSGTSNGNYDQCLSIESPDGMDGPKIYGQYCGITAEPYLILDQKQYPPEVFEFIHQKNFINSVSKNLFSNFIKTAYKRTYEDWLTVIGAIESTAHKSMKIMNGLCLPTTCTPNDISKAVNDFTYPLSRIPFKLSDDCDYNGKPIHLNKFQIISIIGLSSVFMVFLLSTIIDCLPKTSLIPLLLKNSTAEFYINSFSAKQNAESIFGTKQFGKFKSLEGFRAILTFYVVLLHTYEFGLVFIFNRNHYLGASYKMSLDYRNMFLPNILLMDNFMLVSAFLLGNTILSKLEKSNGQFNYLNYLLFRYLRILPILVCGLFVTFLFEIIGDGPFWNSLQLYFVSPCYDRWYKTLLMFNNAAHYPNENSTVYSTVQCMTITWYSSCDFQLFAMSPIVFLMLYKKPKIGVIWSLFLLLIAVFLPLFTRTVLNWPHVYEIVSYANFQELFNGWVTHYWGPINYIQTYIIGILIAFVARRKPNVYLGGRIGETFIWFITAIMSLSLFYWQRNFLTPAYPFDGLNGYELYVYLIFHKLLYLSWFCWLLFACVTGRGGFINEALGWKGFKFIDNVTLEMYIMHSFVFVYRIGVNRDMRTYTDYYIWTSATSDFVISYFISVIVALVVTRPFTNLTMALLRPEPKRSEIVSMQVYRKASKILNDVNFPVINAKDINELNVIHFSSDKIVYRL